MAYFIADPNLQKLSYTSNQLLSFGALGGLRALGVQSFLVGDLPVCTRVWSAIS